MTETLIEIEARWANEAPPRVFESASVVSAWTSDAEIAEQAARLTVYGNRYDLDTALRLFRSQLRLAAMTPVAAGVTAHEREVLCDLYLDADADHDELEDATHHLVEELGVTAARARELVTLRLCEAAAASE